MGSNPQTDTGDPQVSREYYTSRDTVRLSTKRQRDDESKEG